MDATYEIKLPVQPYLPKKTSRFTTVQTIVTLVILAGSLDQSGIACKWTIDGQPHLFRTHTHLEKLIAIVEQLISTASVVTVSSDQCARPIYVKYVKHDGYWTEADVT